MKHLYCFSIIYILLNSCTGSALKQNKNVALKANDKPHYDTIMVANDAIASKPFKKEPKLADFNNQSNFKKSIKEVANKHDETQVDELIEFTKNEDMIVFYKTNSSVFLKSILFVSNYGYLFDFLEIESPIDLLLAKINIKNENSNLIIIINDTEEYSQIRIIVENRKIVKITLENIVD